MSNIPKSRRKATSLDALALAQNIRSEITTELMLTFGYSEKRLEQHIRKVTSRDQIYKMNSLYVKLFGRSVTWKKGHGRLRWLMAHPSAA